MSEETKPELSFRQKREKEFDRLEMMIYAVIYDGGADDSLLTWGFSPQPAEAPSVELQLLVLGAMAFRYV